MDISFYEKAHEDLSAILEILEKDYQARDYSAEDLTIQVDALFGKVIAVCDSFEEEIGKVELTPESSETLSKLSALYGKVIGFAHEIHEPSKISEPPKKKLKIEPYQQILQVEDPMLWNLRGQLSLKELKNDYQKKELKDKIDFLEKEGYRGFHQVRGDGNCYYRAFYTQLLTQGLKQGRGSPILDQLIKDIDAIQSNDAQLNMDRIEIREILKDALESGVWLGGKDLVEHIRTNEKFDIGFVRILRAITANFIKLHQGDEELLNGISPKTILEANGASIEGFCREVDQMGHEAESVAVTLLPIALKSKVTIAMLMGDAHSDVKPVNIETYGNEEGEAVLHMLFRPGHYDILYK